MIARLARVATAATLLGCGIADADWVPYGHEFVPALADDLPRESLVRAIDASLQALERRNPEASLLLGDAECPNVVYRAALRGFREAVASGENLEELVSRHFRLAAAKDLRGNVLFTGYFEPVLDARRAPDATFRHPIYRRPDDLLEIDLEMESSDGGGSRIVGRDTPKRLEAYPTRSEIDRGGALAGLGLELAWLADPVSVFFLHIQGSGTLRFEDGSTMRIGYAASNGYPYTSVGRVLVEEGTLVSGETTSHHIQAYLRTHPERRDEILDRNERYIFFRKLPGAPEGAHGVPLTPGRSIAADPEHYAPGALAWIDTKRPVVARDGTTTATLPLRRFALVQDEGAAIRGPDRIDVFFGRGRGIGMIAGAMAYPGEVYLLVPSDC